MTDRRCDRKLSTPGLADAVTETVSYGGHSLTVYGKHFPEPLREAVVIIKRHIKR